MNWLCRDWYVANSAKAVSETWSLAKEHPCPRPLDQVTYFVRSMARPGGTVLDPFAGSGTTPLACLSSGRKCVAIEKDLAYFSLMVRRVEDSRGADAGNGIRKQMAKLRRKK